MEYGEAWLLETLALVRLPVGCMKRTERPMKELLNRGYHKLSKEDLVLTLTQMFERGDIDAYHDDEMQKPALLENFLLALDDFSSTMHCGVTTAGGQRWEVLARPDWSRYFEDVGWDGETVEITAGTRERLLELVSNADVLWDCKMDLGNRGIIQITPWEPTAWKTLPHGFRAKVEYVENPFTLRPREEILEESRRRLSRYIELRSWATSICNGHPYI